MIDAADSDQGSRPRHPPPLIPVHLISITLGFDHLTENCNAEGAYLSLVGRDGWPPSLQRFRENSGF